MIVKSVLLRLIIKLALLVSVVCVTPIALIRAQPYDDSELRAFLTPPEGCPAPCFMGIRPGVTTTEEAIAILEGHEWVQEIKVATDKSLIWIEWNALTPLSIDQLHPYPYSSYVYNLDKVVRVVNIKTPYPVGAIYLLDGQPQATDSFVTMDGIVVSAYYFDSSIKVNSYFFGCPVTQVEFWNSEMYLIFSDLTGATGFSDINSACW